MTIDGPQLPPLDDPSFDADESWRDSVPPPATNASAVKKNGLRIVTEKDARAEILLGPNVHVTTERMADALQTDPDLYQRAGALAHVVRAAADELTGIAAGTPTIRTAPVSWLVDRVSRHAMCMRRGKGDEGGWSHVPPPVASVRAVAELAHWPGIRTLRGVVEAPTMRPDGTVVQDPGYDRATGYLYEPRAQFPRVAESPSHSDAVIAYARLLEPFRDFPYVAESHRAATIAAILTLLARPAITGAVPCWLFDASAARSGKSLQVDVISLIATGRAAGRMTYPETDEELEKAISSFALRGAAVVNFDNVARKFGGAALDKVITAVDQVDFRMLGSTEIVTVDWRAVVFASGNNVACRGDMLARVLSPRLETPLENPEKRDDLRHPDLRAWVAEHRGELVHAALTLLRAYVVAGRPAQDCPRWGGFESWSRLIPHALRWVGADDPMGARRGLEGDDDPERVAQQALVEGWRGLGEVTIKGALTILYPGRAGRDPEGPPDGHDDLREAIEVLTDAKPGFAPSTRKLGDALRKVKGRPFSGRRLVTTGVTGKVARWKVVSPGV